MDLKEQVLLLLSGMVRAIGEGQDAEKRITSHADVIDNVYKNITEDLRNLLKKRGWDDEASKTGRNKWHKLYIESQQEIKELKDENLYLASRIRNETKVLTNQQVKDIWGERLYSIINR